MNNPETYSRKTKVEEKRNIRKALLFSLLSLVAIALFIMYGFNILGRFAVFLGDLKKGSQAVVSDDTTPPIPPRFEPIPKATNKAALDIKGSTEPGASIEITLNGREEELLANSDGEFTYTADLHEGENSMTAYSQDSVGNKSVKSEAVSIVYDKTPPQLDVTKPQEGETFYGAKGRQLVITGKTEANTQVNVNGRHVVVEQSGNFTFMMTLTEGENTLTIKAQDMAGNEVEKVVKVTYSP